MIYAFTPNGWDDYAYWQGNDKKTRKKINDLIKDIARNGAGNGLGKPEPLTGNLSGFYSRKIDDKNRLVYKVEGGTIVVISCRYHYSDH